MGRCFPLKRYSVKWSKESDFWTTSATARTRIRFLRAIELNKPPLLPVLAGPGRVGQVVECWIDREGVHRVDRRTSRQDAAVSIEH